jgi:hypothetical protein
MKVLAYLLLAFTATQAHALTVCTSPCPSHTVATFTPPPVSTGADGSLLVTSNLTLSLMPDAVFDFTTLNISAGSLLDFGTTDAATTIYLLATSDIVIDGSLNAGAASLVISTPGSITLNNNLPNSSNITLFGNSLILGQSATLGGNSVQATITRNPSGSVSITNGTNVSIVNLDQPITNIGGNISITGPGAIVIGNLNTVPSAVTISDFNIPVSYPIVTLVPTPLPATALLFMTGFGLMSLFYRKRANIIEASLLKAAY